MKDDIKEIFMVYVSFSVNSFTISIIYFKIIKMFIQLKINLSKLAKLNSILIPFKNK